MDLIVNEGNVLVPRRWQEAEKCWIVTEPQKHGRRTDGIFSTSAGALEGTRRNIMTTNDDISRTDRLLIVAASVFGRFQAESQHFFLQTSSETSGCSGPTGLSCGADVWPKLDQDVIMFYLTGAI